MTKATPVENCFLVILSIAGSRQGMGKKADIVNAMARIEYAARDGLRHAERDARAARDVAPGSSWAFPEHRSQGDLAREEAALAEAAQLARKIA